MFYCFDSRIAKEFGVNAAVLFQNIAYWVVRNRSNQREGNLHDGKYWTYNTIQSYIELFPFMTRYSIEKALKDLADRDMIVIGEFNDKPFDRTKWYTLGNLGESVLAHQNDDSIFRGQDTDFSKSRNGVLENEKPIPYNKPNNKQETISKEINFFPYSKEGEKAGASIAAEPALDSESRYAEIVTEFLNSPITLESFCKNNNVTPEQCKDVAEEIAAEWEFVQPKHNNKREARYQLLRALEVKIRVKREIGLLAADPAERKARFAADCKALQEKGYKRPDVAKFYKYYTQPSQDGTGRMMFETYKAWDSETRFKIFMGYEKK